jgi:hypothetical protein
MAQGFVTRNLANKTSITAVRLNFVTENCWLAAAIESLRQKKNQDVFETVVPKNCGDLEFRWGVPIFYTIEGVQILDSLI